MKKYFIGLLAVVIAVTASAFSLKNKLADPMHVFSYSGLFIPGEIANLDNWDYLGEEDEVDPCLTGSDKACQVKVTDQDIDYSSTQPELNTSVTINEAGSGSNIRVGSISGDGPTSASNRTN